MNIKYSHIIFILLILLPLFNTLWLPLGLYYTTLLTPLLFFAMIRMGGLPIYSVCFTVSLVFVLSQMAGVEHWKAYIVSFILWQTVLVFIIFFYFLVKDYPKIEKVFKYSALLNAALLLPALFVLFVPVLRPAMWYEQIISSGIPKLARLKMFNYEASYYSLSLVPIFAYYGLKKLIFFNSYNVLFLSLIISLILSFSLGVTGGMLLSALLLVLIHLKSLGSKVLRHFFELITLAFLIFSVVVFLVYSGNPLMERLHNIYVGADTSARGRTYESFYIVWNVIQMKSIVWGLGPGQFKYIGRDFLDYYYVLAKTPVVARIPNAVAETLCIFGLVGLVLRFLLIAYFFLKTKVWNNYFRLFLFIFIFIYQFTGSYLFNPLEYVIWVMAFSPTLLPKFDKNMISNSNYCESTIY